MRNWEEEFGSENPTPEAILLRMRERFPEIQTAMMYWDRDDGNDYVVIQKSQYQEEGFRIALDSDTKYWDFLSEVKAALKNKLTISNRMQKAPGAEPRYNPNADRDISTVLAYEANEFMENKGSHTFKATAMNAGCGMILTRTDPFADPVPSTQLFSELRLHLQSLFNVTISDLDAENKAGFEVIPYVYQDNRKELDAERQSDNVIMGDGRAEYLEEYIARKGALTPIRHGWVAGYSGEAPRLRESRVMYEDGGATYIVPGSAWTPSRAVAKDLCEIRELTNVGHQTEEWLFQRCLPDIFLEDLLVELRRVHALAAGAEERETFSAIENIPVEQGALMPKPIMALRVGDRFGTKSVGSDGGADDICHWCEVKSIEENTLTAEILNGAYLMQYDLLTGVDLGVPSHNVAGGGSVIFFTADNPVKHGVNYEEGLDYMREFINAQNAVSATSEMSL